MGDVIMLLERLAERPSIRASRSAFFFDLACPFSYLTAERVEDNGFALRQQTYRFVAARSAVG